VINVHKSRTRMRFVRASKTQQFDLHDFFDVVKISKNRKCASCLGGEHGFEKQLFDTNSHQGVSVAFRSAIATIFLNET